MASTHGRKPLPVPQSLVDALDSMGFVEMPNEDSYAPRTWRLPRHPQIALTVVASNVPGDAAVNAHIVGRKPQRASIDDLIVELAIDIAEADSPNRKAS